MPTIDERLTSLEQTIQALVDTITPPPVVESSVTDDRLDALEHAVQHLLDSLRARNMVSDVPPKPEVTPVPPQS